MRITGNKWNWFSQSIGGDPIEFLRKYEGLSFSDAVTELCGEQSNHAMPIRRDVIITPPCSNEEKEVKLPLQAENNKRAYWYLCSKRGITPRIVKSCLNSGSIYQTEMYWKQNESGEFDTVKCTAAVVFVGFNPEGKASYASIRSTTNSGKYESYGSDKHYGFCLPAKSDSVSIFESPIDAMSHASLYPHTYTHRLSLGGISPLALEEFLKNHPEIRYININLDNDERGRSATESIKTFINEKYADKYKVYVHIPPHGKDWNDTLVNRRKCLSR